MQIETRFDTGQHIYAITRIPGQGGRSRLDGHICAGLYCGRGVGENIFDENEE